MPLEPIEEKDLDMKNKFIESGVLSGIAPEISEAENVATPDLKMEKQEGVIEEDDAYTKIVSKIKTKTQPIDAADIDQDMAVVDKAVDAESRINNLVDIAMQKGVGHAVKVAKQLDDNYILDGLHDKLMMDEFHDALMRKGLIEEL